MLLEALVAEVHEQVGGSERVPGTDRRQARCRRATIVVGRAGLALPEAAPVAKVEKAPPVADAAGKVTLTSRRAATCGARARG